MAAAQKILAPYTGQPSPFGVDTPLARRPSGATFGYLQCATPVCAQNGQLLTAASKVLGVNLKIAKANASATGLQSAMDSLIESKVDAVLIPAVEPSAIKAELATLKKDGIPTVANGVMDYEKYGITAANFNNNTVKIAGRLLAALVVSQHQGSSRPVFYRVPELSFASVEQSSFVATMKELCPKCQVRTKDISVSAIGSTAPGEIVSDLQAHPEDNVAVFSSMEMATGLPSAMKVASLHVDTDGFAPNPGNLQDIKNGDLTAAIGLDIPVDMWSMVDAAARLMTHQSLTQSESEGLPPMQVLGQKDITFDPTNGWTGYPDFAERFAKIWSGQG